MTLTHSQIHFVGRQKGDLLNTRVFVQVWHHTQIQIKFIG
jgi:hypothetical protein